MDGFIERMAITIFSVTVGIGLSWFVQAFSTWRQTHRLAKGLVGKWNSTYRWDEPGDTWVKEKVDVSVPSFRAQLFSVPFYALNSLVEMTKR